MYKLNGTMSVKRLSDGAFIPFTDGNSDYEEYKTWLEKGNKPEPEFDAKQLEDSRVISIKNKAGQLISERYPTFKQQNVALGLETKEYSATMVKFIKDIKAQSTKLEKDTTKTSDDFIITEL